MKKIKIKPEDCQLTPYDMADHLHTEKDIFEYLQASFEICENEREIAHALATAVRAQGMLKTSQKTGLNRQNLYKTLTSGDGVPTLATVNKLIRSFGGRLSIIPESKAPKIN